MNSNKRRTSFTMEKWPTANSDYKSYRSTVTKSLENSQILDEEYFYWILDSMDLSEINELKKLFDYYTDKKRYSNIDPDIRAELIDKKEELLSVIEEFNNY